MRVVSAGTSRFAVAAFGVLGLTAGIVGLEASHGRPASLEERTRGAGKIIVANARTVDAGWRTNVHGDRLIVSRVVLDVEESLKGEAPARLSLEIEGGTVDGVTLRVSGVPQIQEGERGVFFLEEAAPGIYRPHLRGDGILILDGPDVIKGSGVRLEDVRRAVRAQAR